MVPGGSSASRARQPRGQLEQALASLERSTSRWRSPLWFVRSRAPLSTASRYAGRLTVSNP